MQGLTRIFRFWHRTQAALIRDLVLVKREIAGLTLPAARRLCNIACYPCQDDEKIPRRVQSARNIRP